jgi:hypothetical protein
MMPLQRACDAESQVGNKLSNGPLRVQSNVISQSILQRVGIRQLPRIYRYPAKSTGLSRECKVAPRIVVHEKQCIVFVLDKAYFVEGIFIFKLL